MPYFEIPIANCSKLPDPEQASTRSCRSSLVLNRHLLRTRRSCFFLNYLHQDSPKFRTTCGILDARQADSDLTNLYSGTFEVFKPELLVQCPQENGSFRQVANADTLSAGRIKAGHLSDPLSFAATMVVVFYPGVQYAHCYSLSSVPAIINAKRRLEIPSWNAPRKQGQGRRTTGEMMARRPGCNTFEECASSLQG